MTPTRWSSKLAAMFAGRVARDARPASHQEGQTDGPAPTTCACSSDERQARPRSHRRRQAEVDLVADEIDVAVPVGKLADSSFVIRRLTRDKVVVVGARDYLERHGTPTTLEDLGEHVFAPALAFRPRALRGTGVAKARAALTLVDLDGPGPSPPQKSRPHAGKFLPTAGPTGRRLQSPGPRWGRPLPTFARLAVE
jgi:hypothetical protein